MPVQITDVRSWTVGLDKALDRLDKMMAAFEDMQPATDAILDAFHNHTAAWMGSEGDGTYDPLSPSTVRNKAAAGYPAPERPLFATGTLYASAIGKGPWTVEDTTRSQAFEALDWMRDGWNIPALHQEGVPWRMVHRRAYVTRTGKHMPAADYMWHLPARPIFTIDELFVQRSEQTIVDHIFNPRGVCIMTGPYEGFIDAVQAYLIANVDTSSIGTGAPLSWTIGGVEQSQPGTTVPLPAGFLIPFFDSPEPYSAGVDMHTMVLPIQIIVDLHEYGPPAASTVNEGGFEQPGYRVLMQYVETVTSVLRNGGKAITLNGLIAASFVPVGAQFVWVQIGGKWYRAARLALQAQRRVPWASIQGG